MDAAVPDAVLEHWEDLVAECEETAASYQDDGWATQLIHIADLTFRADGDWGLSALTTGEAFEELTGFVEGVAFERAEVRHRTVDGVRLLVIVVEAPAAEKAVIIPAYILPDEAEALAERAREEGGMRTHVRTLSDDERVTFTHDDPELFFE